MSKINPYFRIKDRKEVKSIEELVTLNIPKEYDADHPGLIYSYGVETDPTNFKLPHETSGMFRGQLCDWSLIPKCYRGIDLDGESILNDAVVKYEYFRNTYKFTDFCSRAELQNPEFPTNISDRMSIAQHFGVPTPLLDWSQNILTAVFFAIRDVYSDPEFIKRLEVNIYHIEDERYLENGIPDIENIALFNESVRVKPFSIDRRIERQKAIFTYHPHPKLQPPKVPINVYSLNWVLIDNLIELMKGFGFTEDYYFPDYAGIANAVNSDSHL